MDQKLDRISGLPPFIIHQIMTYLSVEEVAQTSLLSKRWNQLRISFPIFDFDQSDFDPYYFVGKGFALHKFLNFVDTSLVQFSKFDLSMLKFRLFISILYVKESAPYIDKWVELATEKEVKEFDLEFLDDRDYSVPNAIYTLPQTIFSARSLTTLRLVGCKLENISDTIRSNSLRKLSLDRVFINEEMVQKLCCEFPLLEELFLWHCWGLKRFCVFKALKLKILIIKSYEFESVKIVVPDLQELALEFGLYNSPRVIDIVGGSKLKKLKFVGTDLKEQDFHHFMSKFPLLEDLTFIDCYLLERITISSNQLKKFRVNNCFNMKAIDLDTPNLLSFTYEDSSIPTSRINALCPWQVQCYPELTFNTQWCLVLREFLGVSHQIETLSLYVRKSVCYFNLEYFRKSCPSLPCSVGNLKLYTETELSASDSKILMEALLWICYPKTLSFQTFCLNTQDILFESFYNEWKNRDVSCCNSHEIKCWRHFLKDIKVESFEYPKDRKLVGANKLMSTYPWGIKFQLDWCFPVSTENA